MNSLTLPRRRIRPPSLAMTLPRAVNVGRFCCFRCRLLPPAAVVVGHHCRRCRPLSSSAVVVGRCRHCHRLLLSAVVVGCCHCLPLTSPHAAAIVYHCLRHSRLLLSRTTTNGGCARERVGCQRLLEYCKTHSATLPASFKTLS